MEAEPCKRHHDIAIATLAGQQHGVVARGQLTGLGLSRGAIGHRLDCGRLHPVHRGVFAVGHRVLSREGRWMAAVLAGGSGAVLSHRSAAALWGLRLSYSGIAEVTVPRRLQSRPTLRLHRAELALDETTTVREIAVTTPSRTLLDLAAVVLPRQLERAVEEAEVLRLADSFPLADLIERHRGRAGVAALRRLRDEGQIGATVTRSELEDRFLCFLAAHDLPHPEVNVALEIGSGWIEADCAWRGRRVVVEMDGYASHGTRAAFEKDRARDRRLQSAGWRVVRITWRHLQDEPAALAGELRALLDPPRRITSDAA